MLPILAQLNATFSDLDFARFSVSLELDVLDFLWKQHRHGLVLEFFDVGLAQFLQSLLVTLALVVLSTALVFFSFLLQCFDAFFLVQLVGIQIVCIYEAVLVVLLF